MMDAPFPDEMMGEIRRFFKDVHPTLTPGQDVYPEVFRHPYFFPLQRQRELAKMMQIAQRTGIREPCDLCGGDGKETFIKLPEDPRPKGTTQQCSKCNGIGSIWSGPRTVCEIGADKGGGLYHWCMCLPSVKNVIGIEIRGTPYEAEFRRAFPRLNLSFFPGSSRDATFLRWWRDQERIDCLFIDGDKLTFLEDFDAYRPMMSKGGIVFMHDIQDEHPRRSFEAVKRRGYRTGEIIDTSEAWEAIERERDGEQVLNAWDGWLKHWKGKSCGVGVIYID